ncbi:uncharacterized protein LOC124931363 [Impatiens glandulifera]|uniref:uncharacterized protein LOC124931363 n=1 Tax=Impatiens glandulifera TaxID=253017 RepID=UPI001FB184E4|nr:uncharacterized protein LOC124931363 [Impatiens glandulifera]
MKDDDSLPVSAPSAHISSISKKDIFDSAGFGKGRYKFWALAAILLLAFWSMLAGTLTLRWSVGNLNRLSDEFDKLNSDDLDVLELEEREKVVRHMWDIYMNSRRIRLPRFWQQAFVAAYEDLTSDDPGVRDSAISEIAKMSLRSLNLDPPPLTRHLSVSKPFREICFIAFRFESCMIRALIVKSDVNMLIMHIMRYCLLWKTISVVCKLEIKQEVKLTQPEKGKSETISISNTTSRSSRL